MSALILDLSSLLEGFCLLKKLTLSLTVDSLRFVRHVVSLTLFLISLSRVTVLYLLAIEFNIRFQNNLVRYRRLHPSD